jgi:hypothetical protein
MVVERYGRTLGKRERRVEAVVGVNLAFRLIGASVGPGRQDCCREAAGGNYCTVVLKALLTPKASGKAQAASEGNGGQKARVDDYHYYSLNALETQRKRRLGQILSSDWSSSKSSQLPVPVLYLLEWPPGLRHAALAACQNLNPHLEPSSKKSISGPSTPSNHHRCPKRPLPVPS